MRPIHEVSGILLSRFREKGVAQVEGYNKYGYIGETNNAVIVSRQRGNETRVPFTTIEKAIGVVRNNPQVYNKGPSGLRLHGFSHITSPVWAILHLVELSELLE